MVNYLVLYDGWDLAYQPNSPTALHILGLLDAQLPGRRSTIALPAESFHKLPGDVTVDLQPAPNTERAHLSWEQRRIPALARRLGADLVHWFGGGPALFGAARNIISPVGYTPWALETAPSRASRSFTERMRTALAQGGFTRADALLWPADLPQPHLTPPAISLPPVGLIDRTLADNELDDVEISLTGDQDFPESFILYHGPTTQDDLYHLLDAWRWASGSIGEYYPLLVVGAPDTEFAALDLWLHGQGFGQTVQLMPPQTMQSLIALYRRCSALFHPTPISPWGIPLRLGLACARPIVALDTPWSDAIVGPAAYLVPSGEDERASGRALGAALTTVIVEENLAGELSRSARQRAAGWDNAAFPKALERAYLKVLGS